MTFKKQTSESFIFSKDAKTLKTTNLAFEVNKIVKSKTGSTIDDFIDSENNKIVIGRMNEEIVKPILQMPESPKAEQSRPVSNPTQQHLPPQRRIYTDDNRIRDPLRNIGRGDLNPFGQGGGMIFQPDLPFGPGGFGR